MSAKNVTEKNLTALCASLTNRDEDLARIFDEYETPPLWRREPGFATLIHIILEQQVSLASAQSAFDKLRTKLGEITPEGVLSLSDEELKAAYFSRQKTSYARNLANAVKSGALNLHSFDSLPDEAIKNQLVKIKGIGSWTADIYLLMALMRADVMPKGDLALHVAWQKLKNLPQRPGSDEFQSIAEKWKPLRSVAARLLWHFYLSAQG